MPEDELYSIKDVAEILNVPLVTVQNWIREGVLTPSIHSDDKTSYFRPQQIQSLAEKKEKRSSPDFEKKRILIIEDDTLVAKSLKSLLEKEGWHVFYAPLGLAALDLGVHEEFDLVITDIRMPGMNGIEALKALRVLQERFGKPQVPEIILTAYDIEEVRREAQKMGVAEFLMKPFQVPELLDIIRRHLKIQLHSDKPSLES